MSDLPNILAEAVPYRIDGQEWQFAKIDLGMMAEL